jgi:hypothetical protein
MATATVLPKKGANVSYLKPIILGLACFALGVGVTRYYDIHRLTARTVATAKATVNTTPAENKNVVDFETLNYEQEPLWAYGFDKTRAPGEKARPQNPPSRNLR